MSAQPIRPFEYSGVERDAQGIQRYVDLPRSLVAMLRATVERVPDHEALYELGGERVTYREIWDRAAAVAGGLRDKGINRGDRVAIRLPNGIRWVEAFYGAVLSGAVVVPVNTRFTDPEVDYVLEDSGASYVFREDESMPSGTPYVDDSAQQGDLAAIFYTSGTTGFPKGAMTSHENFLANVETCLRCLRIPRRGEDQKTLVSVPLFHVTGCNSQLLVMAAIGGSTVIMPAFEVQEFLRAVQDEKVNLVITVPAIYWLAINQPNFGEFDVSAVQFCTYGGAPIAPDLVGKIKQSFPNARVGNGFGLTETSSVSTFLPDEFARDHADSVGFAAPVIDLEVADPDPQTGVGELLIRGQNIVAGYWNKPEATAATFVDGWLHTGDLARVDELGLTYIVDRIKDMINRGGENVYSVEVENALATHPAVYEVAVVGVPDQMMGEKVGAVVVPKPGATVDPGELVAFAREKLADFKVPQYVVIRPDPLPRNPGGKILKPTLRESTQWGEQLRR
ncbi:MAG TPA: AMP-binding protein [Mycobacteriales bacterium]|jgi:acyl-CoA synthetase (AMP-forming)/AMP-acid ligase II|nr:AMP-binding protein [Mycobacteriales bacterium]